MTNAILELERAATICAQLLAIADSPDALLDSIGEYLGADMGVSRVFATATPDPRLISLRTRGIPDRVTTAYLERYIRLDPARGLLGQPLSRPVVIHDEHRGRFSRMPAGVSGHGYRDEFRCYRDEFLRPNRLALHLGFCFRDPRDQRTFLFDFHRQPNATPFGRLECARATLLAALLHRHAARESAEGQGQLAASINRDLPSTAALSRRERQVATAVAQGSSNKRIAAVLGCSVRTIENHLRAIYAKSGVTSRTGLVALLHQEIQKTNLARSGRCTVDEGCTETGAASHGIARSAGK